MNITAVNSNKHEVAVIVSYSTTAEEIKSLVDAIPYSGLWRTEVEDTLPTDCMVHWVTRDSDLRRLIITDSIELNFDLELDHAYPSLYSTDDLYLLTRGDERQQEISNACVILAQFENKTDGIDERYLMDRFFVDTIDELMLLKLAAFDVIGLIEDIEDEAEVKYSAEDKEKVVDCLMYRY